MFTCPPNLTHSFLTICFFLAHKEAKFTSKAKQSTKRPTNYGKGKDPDRARTTQSIPHHLQDHNVQSSQKSFFSLRPKGTAEF
jgi:hypothetical protein